MSGTRSTRAPSALPFVVRRGRLVVALAAALAAALLASPAVGTAQDEPGPESTDPAPRPENLVLADLSLGVISAGYERVLDPGVSLSLAAGIYGPWYRRDGIFGGGGEVRLFFFLAGTAPGGVYLSPGFRAAYVAKEDEAGRREGFALSGRFSLGYSFVWEILVIRLGFGFQMHVVDLEEPVGAPSDDFAEPYPVADIYLGLAF